MQKLLNACEKVFTYAAVISTFAMMCLTTVDAGGRYLFNRPFIGAFEITADYLMVAAIFLGMSYAYRQGAYIRVTFMVDRLPRQVKLVVNHFVQGASILYFGVLIIATIKQTFRIFTKGTKLGILDFPLGPAYIIIPVGLFLTSLWMLYDLRKLRLGKSHLIKEESPIT